MRIVSAKEMQEIDRRTIEEYGMGGLVLMERAALRVLEKLNQRRTGRTVVFSGGGNNGGDGVAVARELHRTGQPVKLFIFSSEEKLSPDCLAQYRLARNVGVPVEFKSSVSSADLHGAGLLVDALLGTGLTKDVREPLYSAIEAINASGLRVVSVDVPSGVSSDTGEVMGTAVRASSTVTFGLPKRGHYLHPGAGYCGELFIEDIGFPPELTAALPAGLRTLEADELRLPGRPAYSHKGDYGHVLLVGGSRGRTGAALMAARAAMRTGAGLLTAALPETVVPALESRVTEEMILPLEATAEGMISERAVDGILSFAKESADVLAIGPGLGRGPEVGELLSELLPACPVPVVLDADGITMARPEIFRRMKAPLIVTPHPGEMARVAGLSGPAEVERDRQGVAEQFALESGAVVVLKGVPAVISAEGEGTLFYNGGSPALAKAGTGDVLTGITAGLLAQGLEPFEAAAAAVWLHGRSGQRASEGLDVRAVLASDVIENIAAAMKELESILETKGGH